MKKFYLKSLLTLLVSTTLYSVQTINDIHPIAATCNNNAAKIKDVMKYYNIHPLKWHTKQSSYTTETTKTENTVIIIPSYIIIEKFYQGITYPIIITT